jgi:hypothetical protein
MKPQGPWKFSNAAVTAAFTEIVEESVLPKLRRIRTLSAFFRSRARELARHPQAHISERFLASLASGKLDQARNILSESKGDWYLNDLNRRKAGLGDRLRVHGDLLERDDRTELANMLHAFEAYTVKNLGLEKVWQKTPFPLEMKGRS